jgi:hypothetical protein
MKYIFAFLISVGIYIIGNTLSNYFTKEQRFFIGWIAGATAFALVLNFL